jgi:hypothetical protein
MHCKLVIVAPPEADCFSFAALSAANENNIFLCDHCGSSEAGGEFFKAFQDRRRKQSIMCSR